MATGDVYTDGSALGLHWKAARAGWAAVPLAVDGQILWTAGGVCGEPHASIFTAESRAALETLKIAVASLCIHVDNATVAEGFETDLSGDARQRGTVQSLGGNFGCT